MTKEELTKWESEFNKVTHIRLMAMVNLYGFKYFELRLEEQDPEDPKKCRYINTCKFPLSTAKRLEITKTLNGSVKMKAWIATEMGRRYVINAMIENYRESFERYQLMAERVSKNE